jgi:hypothetical protein
MPVLATLLWVFAILGGISLGVLVSLGERGRRRGARVGGWGVDPPPPEPGELPHDRPFAVGVAAFHAGIGATALAVWVLWVAGDRDTYGNGRWWGLAGLAGAVALGLAMALPWHKRRREPEFEADQDSRATAGVYFHGIVGVLTLLAAVLAVALNS